ncbi:MAG: DMT family transporter [Candidatus Methylacidiphilales bacterium]|nr:DMT family transporter [Candidatus Methylacidiphilales bacterium]
MLFACGATLLFSWSVIFARRSTSALGTWDAVWLRTALASCILFPLALAFGAGFSGPGLGWFFLSGVVGFGLSDFALFRALPPLGARLSLLIVQCLAAPIAALIEWCFLGTSLHAGQTAWITLILTGVAIALSPNSLPAADRRSLLGGLAWGLVAATGQALGAVLSRVGFAANRQELVTLDAFSSTAQRMLGGVIFIVVVLVISRKSLQFWRNPTTFKAGLPWAFLNALSGPVLGVTCYQAALREWPSALVLPVVATAPLVIMPWSWWLEGERPTLRTVLGGAMAVAGVAGLVAS